MSSERGGKTILQRLSGAIAGSFLFARGRRLWEANTKNWSLPLSKFEKLLTGGYVILSDHSAGIFPPKFEDQAKAYQAEIDYDKILPGQSPEVVYAAHATKPFWAAGPTRVFITHYLGVLDALESHGVKPPQRILELGCGSGWTAEFLATTGYSVVGTTIAPFDVEIALKKKQALALKGINANLDFLVSPMESVDQLPCKGDGFDAVFVFEALHHAFDWRRALSAAGKSLKPGGWLLLANEPNLLHTFISYRVAKLAHTHEIGMSKTALVHHLRSIGFDRVEVLSPRINNFVSAIWIMARKGP